MPVLFTDSETFCHKSVGEIGADAYALEPSMRPLLWALMPATALRALVFEDPDFYTALARLKAEGLVKWSRSRPLYVLHWTAFDRLVAHRGELPITAGPGYEGRENTIWVDLSDLALQLGWPGSLKDCAAWCGVDTKDPGKALIELFCTPEGGGTPQTHPAKWEQFRQYCAQDVQAMRPIFERIQAIKAQVGTFGNDARRAAIDAMSAKGIAVDFHAATHVAARLETAQAKAEQEMLERFGFKTTQPKKVAEFLGLPDAKKLTIEHALETWALQPDQVFVAETRLGLAGAARKKLKPLTRHARRFELPDCADYIVRGAYTHHGAWTGRMVSRGVQIHNLIRERYSPQFFEHYEALSDAELFTQARTNLRGFFKAREGHTLVAGDYKAIELCVCAWLCGETTLLGDLHNGIDTYRGVAAREFGVPLAEVTSELRQHGKTIELASIYQLSGRGLQANYARRGLDRSLAACERSIDVWRASRPNIVKAWDRARAAFADLVESPAGASRELFDGKIKLDRYDYYITATRPSGAKQFYWMPEIGYDEKHREQIKLWLKDPDTHRMGETHTYGGHLVQGWTQGTAYDLMVESLVRCWEHHLEVVMSTHDELVAEVPDDEMSEELKRLIRFMIEGKPWTVGIPITVETWTDKRFTKG